MQGLSYEYSFQIRFLFRNGGSNSKYTPKPKLTTVSWLWPPVYAATIILEFNL